jgi:hypothetical protein
MKTKNMSENINIEPNHHSSKSVLSNLVIRNAYQPHSWHYCIDAYEDIKHPEQWACCPNCGLKPKVWCFNNGRSTACGCWESKYDHFSVHAESIMSVHKRTDGKKMTDYDIDELRKNWNHWCNTGEILFEHASKRDDGRW